MKWPQAIHVDSLSLHVNLDYSNILKHVPRREVLIDFNHNIVSINVSFTLGLNNTNVHLGIRNVRFRSETLNQARLNILLVKSLRLSQLHCENVALASYVDNDVDISDCIFQGHLVSTLSMCSFAEARELDALGCSIEFTHFSAIEIQGAYNVSIRNSQFEDNTGSYFGGAISVISVNQFVSIQEFNCNLLLSSSI